MDIKTIYIVGVGVIGKSVAKTLRINGFKGEIFGCNSKKNSSSIKENEYLNGEFDINSIDDKKIKNSIIFVCTPPKTTIDKLQFLTKKYNKNKDIIITDVCSAKKDIFKNKYIKKSKNFISIHPMDGGKSGDEEFFFKKYILNYVIKNKKIDKKKYNDFLNFLNVFLNFKNIEISYKKHDKIVALISHLPILIFASYNNDFESINNIMWKNVFYTNKKNIKYFLTKFIKNFKKDETKTIGLIYQNFLEKYKINIDKDLQNPSLKRVLNLDKYNKNSEIFLSNLKFFFKKLCVKSN